MDGSWKAAARERLSAQREKQDGWAYRTGGEPHVEPTVFACLALLASDDADQSRALVVESADWLSVIQQPNGSVGVSASQPKPQWTTSHALLLWNALGGYSDERKWAAAWLLNQRGSTEPKAPNNPVGHDTSIAGWSWAEGTHSWVEPTSMACMAMRRDGQGSNPRVREGLRLLRDRAISTGGWNYGNNVVFGRTLRPQPAPTGMALTALAAGGMPHVASVKTGVSYLQSAAPTIRSPQSLGWAVLGLAAWKKRPADSDRWLAEAFELARRRDDPPVSTAYLLAAASPKILPLLGVQGDRAE